MRYLNTFFPFYRTDWYLYGKSYNSETYILASILGFSICTKTKLCYKRRSAYFFKNGPS